MNNGDAGKKDGPSASSGDQDGPSSPHGEKGLPTLSAADKARLRGLVDTHFEAVWRALRRLGVSATDMDDCAQHVFLVASRKLSAIMAGSEQGFLVGTAVRVASDYRRARERRREAPDAVAIENARGQGSPDELVEQKRHRELLDHVLASMPMDERAVFVMFELEEMSTQEIADVLEVPLGTVASRLRRAREDFERRVSRLNLRGGKR